VITLDELVQGIVAVRDDAFVVTGPGAASGALWAAGDEPATIYNMELAYAAATATGVALHRPDLRSIAIEGDGSLVAGIPVLATIARYRPENLTVVAIVNGVWGTGDNSVPTATGLGADLASIAIGFGWPESLVQRVETQEELGRALESSRMQPGPWFVVVRVDPASYPRSGGRPRPGIDVADAATRCRQHLHGRKTRP
jgi:thiamine pyrophosphate-dependent acetolactate synthase large subunit-like protein